MTDYTEDELRLAREICAKLVEADSLTKLGQMFRDGRLDSDTRLAPALAAIREWQGGRSDVLL